MLKLCECFRSIQGESTHAGRVCLFVRLAGCNLRCRYCDTPFSLADDGERISVSDLTERILGYDTPLVEITGGEPLCQPETPALCRELRRRGLEVLVESNGSYDISVLPPRVKRIVDIKTPGSGEAGKCHHANIAALTAGDEVKFVITDRADFDWAVAFYREHLSETPAALLVSPAAAYLEPACLAQWLLSGEAPFRLQVQLQRYLWPGRMRGV